MKERKLRKEVTPAGPDSLNRSVNGAVIEGIGPDWDHGFVIITLADGRVLAIHGCGVLAFASREIYLEHVDEILRDLEEEEKKSIN